MKRGLCPIVGWKYLDRVARLLSTNLAHRIVSNNYKERRGKLVTKQNISLTSPIHTLVRVTYQVTFTGRSITSATSLTIIMTTTWVQWIQHTYWGKWTTTISTLTPTLRVWSTLQTRPASCTTAVCMKKGTRTTTSPRCIQVIYLVAPRTMTSILSIQTLVKGLQPRI